MKTFLGIFVGLMVVGFLVLLFVFAVIWSYPWVLFPLAMLLLAGLLTFLANLQEKIGELETRLHQLEAAQPKQENE